MSLAAILDAMVASGCNGEQIAAAVKAIEAERESVLEEKRAKAAEKKRRQRANKPALVANVPGTMGDIAGQVGTNGDQTPPSSLPLSSPPTPPPIIPLPSTPSTSLRSDPSAKAALEFFARFWAVYPRKTERKAAAAKFFALLKAGTDPEAVIAGAQRYAASRPEPKYTKHPTTWLNRGCWDDEQLPRDGPQAPERGNWLAYAASGQWKRDLIDDEQRASEHQSGEGPGSAEPLGRGPDRAVFEPGGGNGGGALLDLRVAGSRWT